MYKLVNNTAEPKLESGATGFPSEDLQGLREKIRAARNRICDLLASMDDIRLQQIPQVEADYALKIGCWENALLEAELAARRAKRACALAQAQVNQGEQPDMQAIEAILDEELAEWQAKVEEARKAYELALAYRTSTTPMSVRDMRELKKLYRTLVKRLHPDMHPGEDVQVLFLIAQQAYKAGDVEMLRSLEAATRHLDPVGGDDLESVTDANALRMELEFVLIEEKVQKEKLHDLENCEQMQLRRKLADSAWVNAQVSTLRSAVEEWEAARSEAEARLRELRGVCDES